jgi:large subunit ribosomal protein L10
MSRDTKASAVAELAEAFRGSSGAVLTEYRGLTVKQLKELRRSLGDHASYAVVKNTLTRIAAKDAGVDGLDDMLAGPSAIAFITGDAVEAAKGLRDFAKTNPLLVIKGGVLDGRPVSPAEIKRLADLESREVLLAKLAGAMNASLSQAAALFNAPLAQTARVLGALRAKAEQDPSVLAAGEPAEAAPEAAVAEPAVTEPPETPAVESSEAPADTAPTTEDVSSADSAEESPEG